MLSKKIFIW